MLSGNLTNSSNLTADINENVPRSVSLTAQMVGAGVCYIVCLFIIVINTLFLVCFFINRRQEWVSRFKNIISLVIMDWVVGVTGMLMLAVSAVKNVNAYVCMTVQIMCISSQVGSHMNIFRLCVLRLVTVNTKLLAKESSTKSIIVQTVFVYIASLILCALPAFIWSSHEASLTRCTWSGIYGANMKDASTYMFFVTLIPTVLTSVLYIGLCLDLKRAVAPYVPPARGSETAIALSDCHREHVVNSQSSKAPDAIPTVSDKQNGQTLPMNSAESANTTPVTVFSLKGSRTSQPSKQNLEVPSTSSYRISRELRLPSRDSHMPPQESHRLPRDQRVMTSVMTIRRSRLTSVFKTVGTILLCMNISILPYIIALGINVFSERRYVDGNLFFIFSSILLLNSGLDPIIYMIRIKHLNIAFRRMVTRQCWA